MSGDFYTVLIKINCPYSIKAVELLKHKKKKHKVIDFFSLSSMMRKNVLSVTNNYGLYPKIFKNEEFIGGFDDLSKLLSI